MAVRSRVRWRGGGLHVMLIVQAGLVLRAGRGAEPMMMMMMMMLKGRPSRREAGAQKYLPRRNVGRHLTRRASRP